MLQLRLARGVRFDEVIELTGIDPRHQYKQTLSRLEQIGLVWVDEMGCGLQEKGLNVADAIAAEFVL